MCLESRGYVEEVTSVRACVCLRIVPAPPLRALPGSRVQAGVALWNRAAASQALIEEICLRPMQLVMRLPNPPFQALAGSRSRAID